MTFSVFGCRVTVPFLLLAALAALLFCDRSGLFAAALAAAAVHEGAHLLMMRALRCLPRQIRVTPFGIDIVGREDAGYLKDAAVSVSGPAANLLQYALLTALGNPALRNFELAAFALFLFNILPVGPLDGGQALYALLCLRFEPRKAERAVSVVSFVVLAPLAALGFLVLFRSKWNFSLLLVSLYLTVLLVLKKEKFG